MYTVIVEQNLSPQKCVFGLWIILNNQNPKDSKKKKCSPTSICLKNVGKGPGPRRELSP